MISLTIPSIYSAFIPLWMMRQEGWGLAVHLDYGTQPLTPCILIPVFDLECSDFFITSQENRGAVGATALCIV